MSIQTNFLLYFNSFLLRFRHCHINTHPQIEILSGKIKRFDGEYFWFDVCGAFQRIDHPQNNNRLHHFFFSKLFMIIAL